MRAEWIPRLRSPVNGEPLVLETFSAEGDDIVAGRLVEPRSGDWYRIEDGIADLVPPAYRDWGRHARFCAAHGLPTDPLEPAEAEADANSMAQIAFFARYHDQYEKEVVESPFYEVLYEVTFAAWARRHLRPGTPVLEVGCGSGQQTLPLARQGANVLAVDLSEDMLRLARAKLLASGATGQASFVRGIAEQLPLASESCGGAVICGSLHHFTDPPRALQEAGRVLEPQARFFLLEPHASPVRFLFDWSMRLWTLWEEEARDEPLFDAVQFRHWLAAAGIDHRIGYSTYLPPHLFYWIRGAAGAFLLRASDRVLSGIPGLRRLAGVITAEGTKARVREPELTEAGASSPCPAAP